LHAEALRRQRDIRNFFKGNKEQSFLRKNKKGKFFKKNKKQKEEMKSMFYTIIFISSFCFLS